MRRKLLSLIGIFGALALAAGCDGGPPKQRSQQVVRVDGSSTVYPLSAAAAEAFQKDSRSVQVAVRESGTGGGFQKFCRKEIDVQGASRPILANEMEDCAAAGVRFVEIPVAFDGLTVVVHPSNPVNALTRAELRRMWEPNATGQVTNWRQVNPAFPNLALSAFGPGTASGTFDFFTEAVMGTAKASRTDYSPSEDDNITVNGVSTNAGGVGYFGYAYYEQNRDKLKAVSIDFGSGAVAPSPETIANGSYPLSRPLFLYVSLNALERPAVQQFIRYYLENAARLSPGAGFVPLPASAYTTYATRVQERRAGTAFGGEQDIGGSVEEVLARDLVETAPAKSE